MVVNTLLKTHKSGVSQAIDPLNYAKTSVVSNIRFKVKLAESVEEKEAAYQLAFQAYQKKGYVENDSQELLIEEYDHWKNTAICIAVDLSGQVVGTATVLCGYENTLPCSNLFNVDEYNSFYQTAELVRLAISEDCSYGLKIIQEMYVFLYLHSQNHFNTSYFLIEVNPRHVKFYEAKLGFTKLHDGVPCPRVMGAPAVLLGSDFSIFDSEKISRKLLSILSFYQRKELV